MQKIAFIVLLYLSVLSYHNLYGQTSDDYFVFVKGGRFKVGSAEGDDDELPVRKIYVEDFYMGKYEVTAGEYCKFLNAVNPDTSLLRKYIDMKSSYKGVSCHIFAEDSGYFVEPGFENTPVVFVSWFGADAYCKYTDGRLPSEAEWEYAAKGGHLPFPQNMKHYLYAGSNNPDETAWYRNNSGNHPHNAGAKKPCRAGMFDMSGNVSEWCSDWYDSEYYGKMPEKNPQGPKKGRLKVHRGGSWYNTPEMLRVTNRRASKPVTVNATIGFRVVKDAAKLSE